MTNIYGKLDSHPSLCTCSLLDPLTVERYHFMNEHMETETPELASPKIRPAASRYRRFQEAQTFTKDLGLQTRKEWREYVKGGSPALPSKPEDIPSHPDVIYKATGWQGWPHFLAAKKTSKKMPKEPVQSH